MIVQGDCREVMPVFGLFDLIIADPPYGDTALPWDQKVPDWEAVALDCLAPGGSMWVFGSMRYHLTEGVPPGWRYAQDIVWEKHNGTGFAKDRFRRVHEHVVQFVPAKSKWSDTYNDVQRVPREGPDKSGAIHQHPQHTGFLKPQAYVDDGTRIVRSVFKEPSVRGGPHKTTKPQGLLETLIRTSCRPGGWVGDFFAGSGSAWTACTRADRHYIGAEIHPIEVAA